MIHPRRLKGTPTNIARYHLVGDYYSKGSDEPSQWGGAIAGELGLSGAVDRETFQQSLAGRVGEQQLGRHRADGQIDHHPGWDFAVNAPKSVSIMALVAGDERITAAHERAVGTALAYLEEHAELRRRDSGEIVHETTGRLVFARFTEHASRELDPHLHTHVVVMNMTNREAGLPLASLETRAMFAEQMVAGQIYRNELAGDLRQLGYATDVDPRSGLFEIRDVPKTLVAAMSQRAEQIDAHARENGLTGQAARRKSFYQTRRAKERIGLDNLHQRWAERGGAHREKLVELREQARGAEGLEAPAEPAIAARAALFGIRQAETREAVNNLGRMLRLSLASHVGEVRLDDVRPPVAGHEARAKLLATRQPTGDQVLTRGRTSRRTARLEQSFAVELALALDDSRPIASSDRLLAILETAGLTPAQEQALVATASARDRVTGIHGVAGAGKSTLVRSLALAAEPGTIFIALAPTSSAAANLGQSANIESRTVASLLAQSGRDIGERHVLVLDEAGQMGNRQAQRMMEISRQTGARLIFLGDNKQTGAIEQGKPFWLLQRLGLPTVQLPESLRQETRAMKTAVTQARAADYAASIALLDKVTSGESAEALARGLVGEWTRLKPEQRAQTNILVLENATRLVVNGAVREVLKREGVIAAEDTRLQILSPAGLSDQEKHFARFYSGGQVVRFARDIAGAGLARDTDYRIIGIGRDGKGRQIVRLADELGREIRWDPRTARAAQINVFRSEDRDLAQGDRIQWRLATRALDLKNAERGTVEKLDGTMATIRWDRDQAVKIVDLAEHRTWDHGYAETVYSSQSKTYARAYVLAPVNSALVNGQNYYTAITRARYGVKLWTEDPDRLAQTLARRSGEKTSALEGLGTIERATGRATAGRSDPIVQRQRAEVAQTRADRRDRLLGQKLERRGPWDAGLSGRLAESAQGLAEHLDRFLQSLVDRGPSGRPSDPTHGVER